VGAYILRAGIEGASTHFAVI